MAFVIELEVPGASGYAKFRVCISLKTRYNKRMP